MLHSCRFLAQREPRHAIWRHYSYFVTTPIFYANASPHIGHAYTYFIADALNIHRRLKLGHNETVFSTGTDEHGIKIQLAAERAGVDCQRFCDINSEKFRNLFKSFKGTVTDFIRTTQDDHSQAVRVAWGKLAESGHIYKSDYQGWYCSSDETFVPKSQVSLKEIYGKQVNVDPNDNVVVWSSETNYLFKLSQFKEQVLQWLVNEKPVVPEEFNDSAIAALRDAELSADISISRPKSRQAWGIEVPTDDDQTIYVWLDALMSYLTVAGYPCPYDKFKRWPPDCQIIGKDILKFHAIYWPAFLLALELPLPRRLICHSHWLIESRKMSKSLNNVVCPIEESNRLTVEGLRYYLLRAGTPHSDNNYNKSKSLEIVNAELANTFGNLMSRCCSKQINPDQIIPMHLNSTTGLEVNEIRARLAELSDICDEHYANANFYRGIDQIMSVLRLSQGLYQRLEPWNLVKVQSTDERSRSQLSDLLSICFEALRIASILLQPIAPTMASRALVKMNVSKKNWIDAKVSVESNQQGSRTLRKDVDAKMFPRL